MLKKARTVDLILVALFTALIAVGAFMKIPIPYIPLTFQYLFTMLAGLILGARLGALSVAIYVALGLMGVPIFTAGGGIGYIFQPTFGYLIGFIIAAYVTGHIANKTPTPSLKRVLSANFAGFFIVYACGLVYFWLIKSVYFQESVDAKTLFLYYFLLIAPSDVIGCIAGAFLFKRLKPLLNKHLRRDYKSVSGITQKVLSGAELSVGEAKFLYKANLSQLEIGAEEIRKKFCQNSFDLCAIVNAKSGQCSEDCKFCAQSHCYDTDAREYPLMSKAKLVAEAIRLESQGISRFSIVTSGRSLSDDEVEKICQSVKEIREKTTIGICVSGGLLTSEQLAKLAEAGVERIHNNLETSREHFPQICSTHTIDDKISTLTGAKEVGLSVCSGGLFGLGESVNDRISMAFELKKLGVNSVPINFLKPIKSTPFEDNMQLSEEEALRITLVYRYILPNAFIRLAGGREIFADKGRRCFETGVNATITGDMLTTSGISVDDDLKTLGELGFEIENSKK